MKKYLKIIIPIALLILLVAVAVPIYKSLSDRYSPSGIGGSGSGTGVAAADFTVLNDAGTKVAMSSFAGKPVIVNFWATWCNPCVVELPVFNKVFEQYHKQIEFMMVDLTDGTREKMESVKAFVASQHYNFPVYFDTDGSASDAYTIRAVPTTLFIYADGTIMEIHQGSLNELTLRSYVERLLSGPGGE